MTATGIQPTAALETDLVDGVDMNVYVSFRLENESVKPNKKGPQLNDYSGFRDAYSRVGFKAYHPLNDDITTSIQYKIPLGLANTRITTPDDKTEKVRVAKLQLSSDWGNFWLPYYNVNLFNSYEVSDLIPSLKMRLEETHNDSLNH